MDIRAEKFANFRPRRLAINLVFLAALMCGTPALFMVLALVLTRVPPVSRSE